MADKTFKIKHIIADHWDYVLSLDYPIRSAVLHNVNKVITVAILSMFSSLAKVVSVILAALNILRIELLPFLLSLSTALIGILYLPFLKS